MAKASDKEISFEKAINELEQIVEKLETGEATLEESLELFEKGIKLSSVCQKKLDNAKQRISVITKADDEISEEPFNPDAEDL